MICLSDWQKLKKIKDQVLVRMWSTKLLLKAATTSRASSMSRTPGGGRPQRVQGYGQYGSFALSGASGSFAQSRWKEKP